MNGRCRTDTQSEPLKSLQLRTARLLVLNQQNLLPKIFDYLLFNTGLFKIISIKNKQWCKIEETVNF
ncbi:hypothetical protein BpHYR1_051259 [Brachionus plicatilis]|uniref:Uncharacterized protein n=1 Tax=Brachionus plicatilis TaxID=10195 RepID=A0A3M7TA85_BRAPC|nr:hypothetical protein BpHYR1_051259 [Brachionus plicatilis]